MRVLHVSDIMSSPVVSLERDHSIHLADSLMRLKHIRHLPVVDGEHRLVGLVTHRDIVKAQADVLARDVPRDPAHLGLPVARVMRENVWSVSPSTPVLEAARIMYDHKFGCLPVVEGGRLVGIVTEADLVGALLRLLSTARAQGAGSG